MTKEERAKVLAERIRLPHKPVQIILDELKAGGTVLVPSQNYPGQFYQVGKTCQCYDYLRHSKDDPLYCCKHRLALREALLRAAEAEAMMGGYEPPCPDDPRRRPLSPEEVRERTREAWVAEHGWFASFIEFTPKGIVVGCYSEM